MIVEEADPGQQGLKLIRVKVKEMDTPGKSKRLIQDNKD